MRSFEDIATEYTTSERRKNAIISMIFSHLSELYKSNVMGITVPIHRGNTIEQTAYVQTTKDIISKLEINAKVEVLSGNPYNQIKITFVEK